MSLCIYTRNHNTHAPVGGAMLEIVDGGAFLFQNPTYQTAISVKERIIGRSYLINNQNLV